MEVLFGYMRAELHPRIHNGLSFSSLLAQTQPCGGLLHQVGVAWHAQSEISEDAEFRW